MSHKTVLFMALITSLSSNAFELDVNISKLKFESENTSELENKILAGTVDAPSFLIRTPLTNLTLKKDFHFQAKLYIDNQWLYLDNDMFELTYALTALPNVYDVKESEFENIRMYTNDNLLSVDGDYGHFRLADMRLLFKNIDFTCNLADSILAAPNAIADACLNDSILSQSDKGKKENTHVELQTDDLTTSFDINHGRIEQDQLEVDATQFYIRSKEFTVGSEALNVSCPKGKFSRDMKDTEVVAKCLEDARIKAPALLFHKNDNTMNGSVNIETLVSNGERFRFFGPQVEIELDGEKVNFEDLNAFCKLPPLDDKFDYPLIVNYCMESSFIGLNKFSMIGENKKINVEKTELKVTEERISFQTPNISAVVDGNTYGVKEISYQCKNSKVIGEFNSDLILSNCFEKSSGLIQEFTMDDQDSKFIMNRADLTVSANRLKLLSPKITYRDILSTLNIDLIDSQIECSRTKDDEMTAENILRGCFDSSKITIPKVDIKHSEIDSNIEINKISIDKQKLEFSSPKGKYILNGLDNVYKNFNLSCKLNASFDIAKNLDWESILENCLHSSKVDLKYLVAEYNGDSTFKKFGQKLKGFGIKAINKVDFDSKRHARDKFELTISPKVFSVIPINVKINGKINYKREKRQIIIDVNKTRFYRVIPAKFLVQLILKAFVADDKIIVNDDQIIINIPKDEIQK